MVISPTCITLWLNSLIKRSSNFFFENPDKDVINQKQVNLQLQNKNVWWKCRGTNFIQINKGVDVLTLLAKTWVTVLPYLLVREKE